MLSKTGKRFTFSQNEYILRTSGAKDVVHMENKVKGSNMMAETSISIVGIIVTVNSIIVTLISILQTCKVLKHQKSNRPTKE